MPRHVGPEASVVTAEEIVRRMRILPKSARLAYLRVLLSELAQTMRLMGDERKTAEAISSRTPWSNPAGTTLRLKRAGATERKS